LLWYKIQKRAKRYYIHKALLVVHTEGTDRVTKTAAKLVSDQARHRAYLAALNADDYLEDMKTYDRDTYIRMMVRAALVCIEIGDSTTVNTIQRKLAETPQTVRARALVSFAALCGRKALHAMRRARIRLHGE
jgi:hypothetical protein